MPSVRQAVILAAGRGERLYPLTSLRPKVMLPVANKPVLQHAIEALAANEVHDVVLVVGYCREQVQDFFGGGERLGVRIRYVVQEQQIGTGNALAMAEALTGERFLVVPGDNLVTAATLRPLLKHQGQAVLVKENGSPFHYGLVMVKDGRVTHFLEKPGVPVSRWVNTGNYVLNHEVFAHLREEVDLPSALQKVVDAGAAVDILPTEDPWLDATYPWDLIALNNDALSELTRSVEGNLEEGVVIKGPVSIGRGTVIRAHSYLVGPLVIGAGTEIGPYVAIYPGTSIGNNVVIQPFTEIRNSIIEDSVHIGPQSLIDSAILAGGGNFGARFHAQSGPVVVRAAEEYRTQGGAVVAEYVEAGHSVSLNSGVLVGKGARIANGRSVQENIPEDALVM